jgi:prepilin signal peptidase PulO-like enzyme (type II secretory pathway)
LWLGVADLAYAFGLAVVAGGFAALLLVLARRLRQDEEIPFGSFLSAGAGLAVLT